MKYGNRYIHSAIEIINNYKGPEPLHIFLKNFFAAHKKFGSNDRKFIIHACYSFFRTGKSMQHLNNEERMLAGIYLAGKDLGKWIDFLPQWPIHSDLSKRMEVVHHHFSFNSSEIFHFKNPLSASIDTAQWQIHHLIQPDLFIRCRSHNSEEIVKHKLSVAEIPFNDESHSCLRLMNATSLEKIIDINKEAVIQDKNSQKIAEFLLPLKGKVKKVWDCCAASGGKSILIKDLLGNVDLFSSDVRPSIIQNLKKRMKEAGITHYKAAVVNMLSPNQSFVDQKMDLIVCDVPCSGSGTWSRNPENLVFFDELLLEKYVSMQQNIVENAARFLKVDGFILYITCSAFDKENEKNVKVISEKTGLRILSTRLFKGYDDKADTLFAALFKKVI